jgi:O-antigen ligase
MLWLSAALAAGVLVAALPTADSFLVLSASAVALLAVITPLSAILVMLVLAPLRTLITTEAPLKWDVGQLAVAGLLAAWIVYQIARKRPLLRFVQSPVYAPLIVFLLATGLSAFTSSSLSAWLTEWLKWLQMLLLVTVILSLAGGRCWTWVVFGLVLSGLANALVGIYEFFGGSGALHLLINDRFFRAFGTFGQPNPFGGFMGLIAPLALMATLGYGYRLWYEWRHDRSVQPRTFLLTLVYGLSALLVIIGLFMSWSRGAWLGFGVSIVVLLLALPRKTWQSLTLVLALIAVVGLLWFSGRLPASIVARIESVNEEFFAFEDVRGVDITPDNYAVVERLAHWQAALNMIRSNPWLGVGFGNYEVAYPQYRLLNWTFPLGHAHNYYLNIWAEAGIIGLVGYIVLWFGIVWLTWRARCHPDPLARFILIGLLGTWAYLFVHSITDDLYVNNLFLHIGVMLGILAVLYNQTSHAIRLKPA